LNPTIYVLTFERSQTCKGVLPFMKKLYFKNTLLLESIVVPRRNRMDDRNENHRVVYRCRDAKQRRERICGRVGKSRSYSANATKPRARASFPIYTKSVIRPTSVTRWTREAKRRWTDPRHAFKFPGRCDVHRSLNIAHDRYLYSQVHAREMTRLACQKCKMPWNTSGNAPTLRMYVKHTQCIYE